MSEISLKDYFAKLEHLLNASAADEVILHCRHILSYYPKNVNAYRYLGRALLFNGRWEEAGAAMRRVLSVIPNDYTAHLSLSEVYDRQKRGDDSIWHMERAFEQDPNNRELIDGLRGLYRRYRQIEPKIQLTGAAVAHQFAAGGKYDQAIEALRGALQRSPDRVDLKLQLASMQWKHGGAIDGAEAALDVLEVLPDCLEANALLTALWLEEDRPSDAQKYLNRVEAVDPYRALEIAQGSAPEDAFRIDELDYARSAKTEIASARPDWLSDVSATSTQEIGDSELAGWTSGMVSSVREERRANDEFAAAINETGDDFDPFAAITEFPTEVDQADEEPSQLSASAAPINVDPNDPLAWLREAGVEIHDEAPPEFNPLAESDFSAANSDSGDMEWFTATQSDDANATNDLHGNFPPRPDDIEPQAEPSFTWAQPETNHDSLLEEAFGIEQLAGSLEDQNPETAFPDFEFFNAEASASEPADELEQTAAPDWLRDYETEQQTEAAATEVSFSLFDETPEAPSQPLATIDEQPSTDQPQGVPGARRGLTAMLQDANLDWLSKPKQETPEAQADFTSAPVDEWLEAFGSPAKPENPNAIPDWLTSLDDDSNAQSTSQPADDFTFDSFTASGDNEKPEEETPGVFEPFRQPLEEPLDQPISAAALIERDEFDFDSLSNSVSDFDFSEDTLDSVAASADDTFDLNELAPSDLEERFQQASVPPAEPSAVSDAPQMEFEMPTDADFDWISSQSDEEDENAPSTFSPYAETSESASIPVSPLGAAADEAMPDWLNNLGELVDESGESAAPEAEIPAEEIEPAAAEPSDITWLSQLQEEVEGEANAPATAPDVSSGEDDFESLFGEKPSEAMVSAAVEAVDAVAAEMPDWLSDLQPIEAQPLDQQTEAASAVSDEDFNFLFDEENEALTADELSAEAVEVSNETIDAIMMGEGELDALFGGQGTVLDENEAVADETAESADIDAFAQSLNVYGEMEATAPPAQPIASSDMPDWLTSLQPVEFDSAESNVDNQAASTTAPTPESESDFDWLESATVDHPLTVAEEAAALPAELELADQELAALFEESAGAYSGSAVPTEQATESTFDPASFDTSLFDESEPVVESIEADVIATEAAVERAVDASELPDWLSSLEESPDSEAKSEVISESDDIAEHPIHDSSFEFDFANSENVIPADDDRTLVFADMSFMEEPEDQPEVEAQPAPSDELQVALEAISDDHQELQDEQDELHTEAQSVDAYETPEFDLPEALVEVESMTQNENLPEFEEGAVMPDAEQPAESFEFVDELEGVTAANAPDWLNAMVPGLDIDFEAGEDEQIESEFLEEPEVIAPVATAVPSEVSEAARRGNFGWLIEIVEEETRVLPPPPLPDMMPEELSEAPARGGRFSFSKQPAWLKFSRKPAWAQSNAPAPEPAKSAAENASARDTDQDDDFPDWPEDNEPNDLPDWMKK